MELYVLLKIDPKKIVNLGIEVSDIKSQVEILKDYADITHYQSLEELGLLNGITSEVIKPTIPHEVEPIIDYIHKIVDLKTNDLKAEVEFYKSIVKDFNKRLASIAKEE
ncbi:MAG: hypothetical protein FWE36_04750 [Erysipelotrichales bacterium]|nr:hypothetical protein [Erysipelotrichales bacterium]